MVGVVALAVAAVIGAFVGVGAGVVGVGRVGVGVGRAGASADMEEESETCSHTRGWLILTARMLLSTVAYIDMSHFLVMSEAALLTLSLLTPDLWSVVFSIVAERISPPMFFWNALVLISFGVFVYEISPRPIVRNRDDDDDCSGSSCVGDGDGDVETIDEDVVFRLLGVGRKGVGYDGSKDHDNGNII